MTRTLRRLSLSLALLPTLAPALLSAGCNSGLPADNTMVTPQADLAQAAPDLAPTVDMAVPYPAPFPDPPQVSPSGGPVLDTPRIIPIFFSDDDPALVAALVSFESKIGASDYWKATTSEYGVGPATTTAPVMLAEASPKTIDDTGIQKWLGAKLNSNDPAFPVAAKNDLYDIHYPPTSVITLQGSKSCQSFGGYHSNFQLDANHGRLSVAYAVIPNCPMGGFKRTIDNMTAPETHELIEAATDPYPMSKPAYGGVDGDHFYYELINSGGEVGDMCENNNSSYVASAELDGDIVQRTWSNAAILAGHDPCVPAPKGEIYFNAVPEMSDTVTINFGGMGLGVTGVYVPVGSSKVIDLDLYSDGPTGGPFTVAVKAIGRGGNQVAPYVDFALDKDSGVNGDKLKLTITSNSASPRGAVTFQITCSLNGVNHGWLGEVGQTM